MGVLVGCGIGFDVVGWVTALAVEVFAGEGERIVLTLDSEVL